MTAIEKKSGVHKCERLFVEANTAWDDGDLQKAFVLFTQAAELGDGASQLDLGYFFDNGLHVKKDKKKALHWYRKAYVQGDASAANNIGTVYRDLGDKKRKLWWFRRAAALGDGDVCLDLGKIYDRGRDVPKNLAAAERFYRRVLSTENVTQCSKEEADNRLARLRALKRNRITIRKKGVVPRGKH
jgi:TPR repeat protein